MSTVLYFSKYINDKTFKKFPKIVILDITAVIRKDVKNLAKKYKLVGVLSVLSKVFEKQSVNYFDTLLPSCPCGYRKGFSTQYAILSLLETKVLRESIGISL